MSARNALHFESDETGRLRARWQGHGTMPEDVRLVVEFLETDIGHDLEYPRRIREEAERIAAGERLNWNCTGNAFALAMTPEKTRIIRLWPEPEEGDDDDDAPAIALETSFFLDLLDRWTRLAQSDISTA